MNDSMIDEENKNPETDKDSDNETTSGDIAKTSHKKPQTLPLDHRVGGNDNAGEKIVKVYSSFKEFVVYRTQHAIRLEENKIITDSDKYNIAHQKLNIRLAGIYSRLPEDLSDSEPINRQIARAICVNLFNIKTETNSFTDDVDKILDSVEQQLKYQRTTNGRIAYFLSSLILPALLVIILFMSQSWEKLIASFNGAYLAIIILIIVVVFHTVVFHMKNTTQEKTKPPHYLVIAYESIWSIALIALILAVLLTIAHSTHGNNISIEYLKVMILGSLGGVFSVATSYSSLEIDLDAPTRMNVLVGLSRIIISILGAIFMYFSIKSGVIFQSISKETSTTIPPTIPYLTYLFVMLAGFSEKLVPNIIQNLSGHVANTDDKRKEGVVSPDKNVQTPTTPSK